MNVPQRNEHEIDVVEVAGHKIPAPQVVCPWCEVLDLGTAFDQTDDPTRWVAICSKGHEWTIILPQTDV